MSLTTLTCIVAIGLFTTIASADISAKKMDRTLKKKVHCDYLLFLPATYDADKDKAFPLILFLHGAGERGSDVNKVKTHGPWNYAQSHSDFPFIIVAPQCPEGDWWDRDIDVLNGLLDEMQAKYRVDKARVYVTGLSMGGFGSWALAIDNPERIAAAAPICGGGSPPLAARMKDVPVWAFHGAKDNVVPLESSQKMIDALKNVGAKDVKFTIYPDANHDSWTETYNNPELYKWFLSHSKK